MARDHLLGEGLDRRKRLLDGSREASLEAGADLVQVFVGRQARLEELDPGQLFDDLHTYFRRKRS